MKRLNPDEFPKEISNDIVTILAKIAEEIPVSKEWVEISNKLSDEQKFQVYERRGELQEKLLQKDLSSKNMLEEERKSNFTAFDINNWSNMHREAAMPLLEKELAIVEFKINSSNLSSYVKLCHDSWLLEERFYYKLQAYIEEIENKYTIFEDKSSILGLSYPSEIMVEKTHFSSLLQYLVYKKADFFVFPDLKTASLKTNDHKELTEISNRITYYENGKKPWSNYFEMILWRILVERYKQDELFKKELNQTHGTSIICVCGNSKLGSLITKNKGECIEYDGKNLLGKYLTMIRTEMNRFY